MRKFECSIHLTLSTLSYDITDENSGGMVLNEILLSFRCNPTGAKRTWQQLKMKYKNIIQTGTHSLVGPMIVPHFSFNHI